MMSKTFFFYDLETSGLSPRIDRIMQFAGIRTDANFKQIGDSVNMLVRLNDDTLPSVDAIMVTGITPQKTIEEGYSEAEFVRILINNIFTPDTIVVGYNNIRFDDEFIRHLLWRNFYDAYEWSYKDGRSRWDMLDVVRMTRALRPDGINWPFDDKKAPINTLESLTRANKLEHTKAHDALSDVEGLIAVTKLIKQQQPQLFDYLFKMRDKKLVKKLVNLDDKQPFVYSSGRYGMEHNCTTVAFPLTSGKNGNVIVYDLRYDPTLFLNLTAKEITANLSMKWQDRLEKKIEKVPVKQLQYNRAPAVAPLGVLAQDNTWKKIELDEETIIKNRNILLSNPTFAENVRSAFESREEFTKSSDAEEQLYDSFVSDIDKVRMEAVRNATAEDLADFHPNFVDERLSPLLLHYKARNYPKSLSSDEVLTWDKWRIARISKQIPIFTESLNKYAMTADEDQQFLLQELKLWAESVMPAEIE